MKNNRIFTTIFLLGITTLACAVPALPFGNTSSPTHLPLPTQDTRLEVMVAETVTAAIGMTQQALPTPTKAAPTPKPTFTPEPTATPSVESMLDKNKDGTSTFIDLTGKYQLTLPMQWLALRINFPEYEEALQLPEASNAAIQRSLEVIKEQDPNVFRLFMLDIAEEHADEGFVTNINLVWDQQMEADFTNADDLDTLAESLPASLENSTVTNAALKNTTNETPYGVITLETSATSQDGADIIIHQTLAFFDLPTGTLNITLSTTEKWHKTVTPSFDEFINSFIVLQ